MINEVSVADPNVCWISLPPKHYILPDMLLDKINILSKNPILINVINDDIRRIYRVFLHPMSKRLEHWSLKVISWLGKKFDPHGSLTTMDKKENFIFPFCMKA